MSTSRFNTELSRQLDRISGRVKGSTVALPSAARPSLLFDPTEAKRIDLDTLFNLGTNGLLELVSFEPRFSRFQDTLFSDKAKGRGPEIMTPEERKNSDSEVTALLAMLCPYFMAKPAHKIIEYLIRNLSVQQYNSDALLSCALPYHDTVTFARLLQLTKLTEKWTFLQPFAHSGSPVTRHALIGAASSDKAVLSFIANLAPAASEQPGCLCRPLVALCGSVIIGVLSQAPSRQAASNTLRTVLRFLSRGLASQDKEYRAAALAVAHVAAAAASPLKLEAQTALLTLIIDNLRGPAADGSMDKQGAATFACVLASVRPDQLPREPVLKKPMLLADLVLAASESGADVSFFVKALLETLCQTIAVGEATKDCWESVLRLITSEAPVAPCIGNAVHLITNSTDEAYASKVLKAASARYPKEVDSAISQVGEEAALRVVEAAFSGTVHEKLGEHGVLSLAIRHPEPAARLVALKRLAELDQEDSEVSEMAKQAVVDLLDDADVKVVRQALSMHWALKLSESQDQLREKFLHLLPRASGPKLATELFAAIKAVRPDILSDPAALAMAAAYIPLSGEPTPLGAIFTKEFAGVHQVFAHGCTVDGIAKAVAGSESLASIVASFAKNSPSSRALAVASLSKAIELAKAKAKVTIAREALKASLEQFPAEMDDDEEQKASIALVSSVLALCPQDDDLSFFAFRSLASRTKFTPDVESCLERALSLVGDSLSESAAVLVRCWTSVDTPILARVRALEVATAFVKAAGSVAPVCVAQFVPALVCAVQSQSRFVRAAALSCFSTISSLLTAEAWKGISEAELGVSPLSLSLLISLIFYSRDEILAEPLLLATLCAHASSGERMGETTLPEKDADAIAIWFTLLALGKLPCFGVSSLALCDKLLPVASALSAPATLKLVAAAHKEGTLATLIPTEKEQRVSELFSPASADLVASPQQDAAFAMLKSKIATEEDPRYISRITATFWDLINKRNPSRAAALVNMLFDVAVSTSQAPRSAARDSLRSLPFSVENVSAIFSIPADQGEEAVTAALVRANAAIDVVVSERSSSPEGLPLCKGLLPHIFGLVKALLSPEHPASSVPSRDYTLQIALAVLASVTRALITSASLTTSTVVAKPKTPAKPGMLPTIGKKPAVQEVQQPKSELEGVYDMGLVASCVKASHSPQVRAHALSLLAAAASLVPGAVLRNVAEILTAVTSSAISATNQADVVSAVEAVVPALASAGHNSSAKLVSALVSNFSGMPTERRLPLFVAIVKALGTAKLGSVLLALLSHPKVGTGADEDMNSFAHELGLEFTPADIAKALQTLISRRSQSDVKPYENASSPLGEAGAIRFVADHVGSRVFVERLVEEARAAKRGANTGKETDTAFLAIFEDLIAKVAAGQDAVVADAAQDALGALGDVLSMPSFVGAITKLLLSKDDEIRRTALELLNDRLEDTAGSLTLSESALFTDTQAGVLALVARMAAAGGAESKKGRQTALLTLEIVARALGKSKPEPFSELLGMVVDSLADQDANVASSALLCCATLVSEINTLAVPHIPKIVPQILSRLEGTLSSETQQSTTEQLACLSAMEVIVRQVGPFLSPYVAKTLSLLLNPVLCQSSTSPATAAARVLGLLGGGALEPRVLLAPAFSVYESHPTDPASIQRLLGFVRDVVSRMGTSAATTHRAELLKFFLAVFGIHREYAGELSAEQIEQIELTAIDAFVQLVLKYTETNFKPMFLKVLDFFTGSEAAKPPAAFASEDQEEDMDTAEDRWRRTQALFFARIVDSLADKLKSIFVPYFGYVLDTFIEHLNRHDSESASLGSSSAAGRKRTRAEDVLSKVRESEAALVTCILDSLTKCCNYDTTTRFISDTSRFVKVQAAVVSQLANVALGAELHKAVAREHVIPCVAAMASAARSPEAHWKPLSHSMLALTRHASSEVRACALLGVAEMWRRAGEEVVALLPETVPYVSEVLEDSSPEVVSAAHNLSSVMQSYLGEESLRDYL